jgi:replication factor A1
MKTEETIKRILLKNPEFSSAHILERLDAEKRKAGGLISDETLLRMIAVEFGVEVQNNEALPVLSIRDLVPSLNDIMIVGRVVAVFSLKTFKGNRNGKFASLFIADKSGILRVVLWNNKANLIESCKIKVGQIIRFSHGYTREDHNGRVELHIGERSEVEISPRNVNAKDYPAISKFATKIKNLTEADKNKRVNVIGNAEELFPASTFKRRDSSIGKVMRVLLADETGEIPVVIWNEKADDLEKILKRDVRLQIVNAKAKKAANKGLEIHVDAGTYVETLASEEEFSKIADLREGLNSVNVEGEVVTKPMLRDIKTSKGELVKLAVFELKDETDRAWVSAWRRHADSAKELKVGDKIIIKNAYVKKGFGDQLELSTRETTSIVKTGS